MSDGDATRTDRGPDVEDSGPDGEDAGPLSFQQEELLATVLSVPECAANYELTRVFELHGSAEVRMLADAVADVVAAQPSLRTVIRRTGEQYRQVVRPADSVEVTCHTVPDLSAVFDAVRGAGIAASSLPTGVPLFRAWIFRLPDKTVLATMAHHLVADGWSLGLLDREISAAYAARLQGRPPLLPTPPMTYVQFARAQRAENARAAETELPFWRAAVGRYPGFVDWPAAEGGTGPDGGASPYAVARHDLALREEMMRGVHALRSAAGVSPFTVLQAATAIGIARVTGQADLLLGTDTANRRPQTRDLIGFMVDAQLTPVTIGNGASLREVVDQIRDHAAAAVPHSRSYCGEIERALGGPEVVKVNANPASSRINGSLDLPGLSAVEVPVPSERRHWRNLGVFWSVGTHSSAGSVMFRPARVDHRTAAAVADTIEASLATADG